jgi:hypothetical protein
VDKKTLERLEINYFIDGEILYKRGFYGTLLKCLDEKETKKGVDEIHEGVCATHANDHMIIWHMQMSGLYMIGI